jgi:hypothetical protein
VREIDPLFAWAIPGLSYFFRSTGSASPQAHNRIEAGSGTLSLLKIE